MKRTPPSQSQRLISSQQPVGEESSNTAGMVKTRASCRGNLMASPGNASSISCQTSAGPVTAAMNEQRKTPFSSDNNEAVIFNDAVMETTSEGNEERESTSKAANDGVKPVMPNMPYSTPSLATIYSQANMPLVSQPILSTYISASPLYITPNASTVYTSAAALAVQPNASTFSAAASAAQQNSSTASAAALAAQQNPSTAYASAAALAAQQNMYTTSAAASALQPYTYTSTVSAAIPAGQTYATTSMPPFYISPPVYGYTEPSSASSSASAAISQIPNAMLASATYTPAYSASNPAGPSFVPLSQNNGYNANEHRADQSILQMQQQLSSLQRQLENAQGLLRVRALALTLLGLRQAVIQQRPDCMCIIQLRKLFVYKENQL